jgi:hypothetical protein
VGGHVEQTGELPNHDRPGKSGNEVPALGYARGSAVDYASVQECRLGGIAF